MESKLLYLVAADSVLLVHLLFVAFVVLGLLAVIAGGLFAWSWVRNPWFRWGHLLAIGVVVVLSWADRVCPLTIWEMALRERAGDAVYAGTFVSHWLEVLLYYSAPPWAFLIGYTAFGALVVASWFWVPPRRFGEPANGSREGN